MGQDFLDIQWEQYHTRIRLDSQRFWHFLKWLNPDKYRIQKSKFFSKIELIFFPILYNSREKLIDREVQPER